MYILLIIIITIYGCGEIISYPDTPEVSFKSYGLYISEDILGNKILLGKLEIDFTDGDGDIGLNQPPSEEYVPDSLKYNLFLSLHKIENMQPVKVEGDEGDLKYRIPYIERTGQNKTIKGTIYIDIEYKTIDYDSIFYTFYLVDRGFNKSNVDTTRVIIFTGIEL